MKKAKQKRLVKLYKSISNDIDNLKNELQKNNEQLEKIIVLDYEDYIAQLELIENGYYINSLISEQYFKLEELKKGA